jgi:acyl-CoA reductase-like NAD-dependent aldehyde dehydrogenase
LLSSDVTSPYDGSVVGTVPVAGADDVEAALQAAEHGAQTWRHTPAHERMRILLRAAELADERAAESARTICAETGKPITEATGEAGRSGELIRLAAFEGTRLYSDTLPLDANRGTGQDKIGFTLRQPCGIVVAITPFNYPALLVLHKLAPALAAGHAVVLKPARTTPLTALELAACFVDLVKVAEGLGARALRATTADEVRAALATTRDHRGPVVIVVPAIPHADLPGAGVWWDVAPAEIAEQEAVASVRAEYEDGLATQRWHG